jgi:glutamine cyclotransferase
MSLLRFVAFFFFALVSLGRAAADGAVENVPSSPAGVLTTYDYAVLRTWPHDRAAFTQGLFFLGEDLIESTGQFGASTLLRVDWRTGQVRQRIDVPGNYFGEGAVALNGRIYQLTWKSGTGFIYDAATFGKLGEFHYEGEGWGLTTDGRQLILSDGTATLRFLDPESFAVLRTVEVRHDNKPIERLNELEFIHGEIFANVWRSAYVIRIDSTNGAVRGLIDFRNLLSAEERRAGADVLNGIAYDPAADRLLVTGKYWPKLFEVKLVPRK